MLKSILWTKQITSNNASKKQTTTLYSVVSDSIYSLTLEIPGSEPRIQGSFCEKCAFLGTIFEKILGPPQKHF